MILILYSFRAISIVYSTVLNIQIHVYIQAMKKLSCLHDVQNTLQSLITWNHFTIEIGNSSENLFHRVEFVINVFKLDSTSKVKLLFYLFQILFYFAVYGYWRSLNLFM